MAVGTLVQVRLPSSTNLPADDVINTFAVGNAGVVIPPDDLADVWDDFYNGTGGAADRLSLYISPAITRDRDVVITTYDLTDPEPRSPSATATFTLGDASGDDPLPLEVALCLSFKGVTASGESPARHRGRIYLGPLSANALSSDSLALPVPEPGLVHGLTVAASRLQTLLGGEWCVWSRADDDLIPLTDAWVDNEFDTQRRRGRTATSRVTVPLT